MTTKRTTTKMIAMLLSLWVVAMSGSLTYAQNDDGSSTAAQADEASVTATVGGESGGKLIIEATGVHPKTKPLYKAHAETTVRVDANSVQQGIVVTCSILQGKPEALVFTITGSGVVLNVTGEAITAWAERREGDARFLEVRLKPGTTGDVAFNVATENRIEVPAAETNVLMLGAGEAVAYSSTINVQSDLAVEVRAVRADGLFPVAGSEAGDSKLQFQSTGDATLVLSVLRSGTTRAPVELVDVSLEGTVDTALKSSLFTLKGKAIVTPESGGRVQVLSGRAALTEVLKFEGFHIALNGDAYELVFSSAGEFTYEIPLAAAVLTANEWRGVDFQVGAGTIVPVAIAGLGEQVEFDKKNGVVPTLRDGKWQGFLPANGSCRLAWKPLGESDAGKLFFSTEGRIDARVEAGLLRQVADITFTVLQGELPEVTLTAEGPGEVVGVEGTNVTGWEIADAANGARTISIRLSRPLEKTGRLIVRSQTPLGEFPARVAALRLTPEGSVRHSGYVRLSNGGAVRIDLAGVQGMSQTAPEQFPGEALQAARQVLAYRFPGAAYSFEVLADQILPEVGVSQVTLYQVTETDRIL
ncbi:MAG: hypothetical protein O3C21_07665, partial [Verrucomicrobia bacterium]|nr:hypothetical protein [Verrucomicrobiota bacterium]